MRRYSVSLGPQANSLMILVCCADPSSSNRFDMLEFRQIADSRNDILAEAAGITAGSWCASPATHLGYELIGAGQEPVALHEGLPGKNIAQLDTYGWIGEDLLFEIAVLLLPTEVGVVAPRDAYIDISSKHCYGVVLFDT